MATLLDSYSESNADSGEGSIRYTGVLRIGQSFEGNGKTLDSVKFYVRKNGSPPGNITAEIYAHSGTYGTSSVGTGSALAVSDAKLATSLPSSIGLVEFVFSGANRITLENGTKYVLVINYQDTGSDINNDVRYTWDQSSPTHPGNYLYWTEGGGWGYINTRDIPFYVYVDATIKKEVSDSMSIIESRTVFLSKTFVELSTYIIVYGIYKSRFSKIIGRISGIFKNFGGARTVFNYRGDVKKTSERSGIKDL